MMLQITQIYFNESEWDVILHSIMNIMTENGARMTHEMLKNHYLVLSYYYLVHARKGLLQAPQGR